MGFGATISAGTSTRVVESILSWRLWGFSVVCFLCCWEGGGQGEDGLLYFLFCILSHQAWRLPVIINVLAHSQLGFGTENILEKGDGGGW